MTSNQGNELVSATIAARDPEMVEEVAIVLDTSTCEETAVVLSDSKPHVGTFRKAVSLLSKSRS